MARQLKKPVKKQRAEAPKKKDQEEKRGPDPREPLAALVFKIVAGAHGDLFYLRVYSGVLKANSRPYNATRDLKEFASKLYHTHADPRDRTEVPAGYAGDIVAVIGMKEAVTGDTICDLNSPILLEPITFAQGVVSKSIEPQSSADKQKLIDSLNILKREDPTFDAKVDAETGQTLMTGMGVLQLEVKQHRLERDITVTRGILNSSLVHPREVFREAIAERAAAVILVHNHPSGDPSPSMDDRKVKEQLVAAGQLLDIPVHDHVIIGRGRYTSFAEAGLL